MTIAALFYNAANQFNQAFHNAKDAMDVIITEEKYLKSTLVSRGLSTYLPLLCH